MQQQCTLPLPDLRCTKACPICAAPRLTRTPSLADLNSGALITQLVQLANTLAAASIPSTELTTLSSAVLDAVANSMAAMNALIETSSSVEDVMKVCGLVGSWWG